MDNVPDILKQAKWLREGRLLFGNAPITKTHEHITINIEGQKLDLAALDKKAEELDLGLGPEDEFLALSVWMGNCIAIHKLEQEVYPHSARQDYEIPDYLAIYKYKERPVTVLVEVKSTFNEKELNFSGSYYKKLRNYAQLIKLPLLIAWKYKDYGFWCLFELERMESVVSAFHIPFFEALQNDLMTVILGNIHVTVKQGSQFVLKIKKEVQKNPSEFIGVITDAYWANWKGERIQPSPEYFMLFFLHCEDEVSTMEEENQVTQIYYTTQDWGVIGYQLLPAALRFPQLDEKKPIDWMRVVRTNAFPVTYADIVRTAKDGLKNGLTQYILHMHPKVMPAFLSTEG